MPERTRATAETLGVDWYGPDERTPEATILVNATPAGGEAGEAGPFAEDEVEHAAAVVDMVYAEHTTALIALAREFELPAADGREILLHQTMAQFAAFTQRVPPKEAMREALRRR